MTIAVPMSWPTTTIPTVAWRPTSLNCSIDRPSSDVSTSTVILPRLNMSSHLNAAASIDGKRRASSLPIRIAESVTSFWIRSEVSDSRRAARASVAAASPRSRSNDSARAVSSAWMTAFIARVSSVSRRRPLSNTADRKALERGSQRVGLAVDQVLPGEPVDVVPEAGLVEVGRSACRGR